jgi:hypothetical protein
MGIPARDTMRNCPRSEFDLHFGGERQSRREAHIAADARLLRM